MENKEMVLNCLKKWFYETKNKKCERNLWLAIIELQKELEETC